MLEASDPDEPRADPRACEELHARGPPELRFAEGLRPVVDLWLIFEDSI